MSKDMNQAAVKQELKDWIRDNIPTKGDRILWEKLDRDEYPDQVDRDQYYHWELDEEQDQNENNNREDNSHEDEHEQEA